MLPGRVPARLPRWLDRALCFAFGVAGVANDVVGAVVDSLRTALGRPPQWVADAQRRTPPCSRDCLCDRCVHLGRYT